MLIVAQYEVLGRSEKTRSVPERPVETFTYLHQGCDKMGRSIGPSAIGYRLFPPGTSVFSHLRKLSLADSGAISAIRLV